MPAFRTYPQRKRYGPYRRRGRFKRYKMGYNQLKRDIWKIKSRLNTESKVNDETVSMNPTNAVAGAQVIPLIAQGTDFGDRVGRTIRATKIIGQLTLSRNASATNTRVKCVIVLDKEGGAAPVWEDVFSSASITALRNINTGRRFRILWSRIYWLNDVSLSERQINIYKPINIKVQYNTTTGVATAVETNQLTFLALSDEVTNTPSVTGFLRLRYIDN